VRPKSVREKQKLLLDLGGYTQKPTTRVPARRMGRSSIENGVISTVRQSKSASACDEMVAGGAKNVSR
jgi:hypothetical protein